MPEVSDSDQVFFLGKKSTGTGESGKWHLYREKSSSVSLCGRVKQSGLHQRLGLRKWDLDEDELDDVKGLGSLCKSCGEYVTGSLSDQSLPKPSDGVKKKSNLVDAWKGDEKKSSGEVYGQ